MFIEHKFVTTPFSCSFPLIHEIKEKKDLCKRGKEDLLFLPLSPHALSFSLYFLKALTPPVSLPVSISELDWTPVCEIMA